MGSDSPYHLGCPAWSIPEWKGTFLPQKTAQSAFLREYSKTFNTVEGNSFFYALPKLEVVERWAQDASEGFEFCMKVPRDLSHGRRLASDQRVAEQLLQRLEILNDAGHLGPTFLQLHASFGPSRLPELEQFLINWPSHFPLSVEVRHESFFEECEGAGRLNALLQAHAADRVVFDSRALFHAPPSDSVEAKSQGRKPRLPVKWNALGARPMVRFVGRNDIEQVDPWQEEVADVVANWIQEGRHPYVFMHTPDDTFAPQLCRRFHEKLRKRNSDLVALNMPTCEVQAELFE